MPEITRFGQLLLKSSLKFGWCSTVCNVVWCIPACSDLIYKCLRALHAMECKVSVLARHQSRPSCHCCGPAAINNLYFVPQKRVVRFLCRRLSFGANCIYMRTACKTVQQRHAVVGPTRCQGRTAPSTRLYLKCFYVIFDHTQNFNMIY